MKRCLVTALLQCADLPLLMTRATSQRIVLMMITRVIVSLLRQALGTQAAPPNQVIIGLSLFLTFFVMGPTLDKVYEEAWQPYSAGRIDFGQALEQAQLPMRGFMLKQTRQSDLALFARLAKLDPESSKAETGALRCWCRPSSPAS
jgi:flagellar biosynthesis protein FliP